MVVVYPIGIPCYFMALLFSHRHVLSKLQQLECDTAANAQREKAEKAEKEAERRKAERAPVQDGGKSSGKPNLQEKNEQMAKVRSATYLQEKLSANVRRITDGYEYRCYWFEVFEAVRKLAVVGLPCVFPTGSVEQLFFGIITCFFTWGALLYFNPYTSFDSEIVARVAQLCLFSTLSASMLLHADPGSESIDIILTTLLILPVAITVATDIIVPVATDIIVPIWELTGEDANSSASVWIRNHVANASVRLSKPVVDCLDKRLNTKGIDEEFEKLEQIKSWKQIRYAQKAVNAFKEGVRAEASLAEANRAGDNASLDDQGTDKLARKELQRIHQLLRAEVASPKKPTTTPLSLSFKSIPHTELDDTPPVDSGRELRMRELSLLEA